MSLKRDTLWSLMPILTMSLISIISVPIYFNVLGERMYGLWFYVQTLTGAFGFMDLGLGVAVGRYIGVAIGRNDTEAVKEYWVTGNAIVLPFVAVFAVVFVVLGVLLGPQWFKVEGPDVRVLQWAMGFGGIGLFFAYYGQLWNVLCQTQLDFRFISVLRTGISLGVSLGSIGVALLSKNVAIIVAFTSSLGILNFLFLVHRARSRYSLRLDPSRFRSGRLREMLPYTAKTFLMLISGSVIGSFDRLYLGRLASPAEFAAYNVALNFGGRLQGLSVAAMGPIFMSTSRGVGGDKTRTPASIYRESFDLMFPWYGLVVVWTAIWHAPLLQLWLGPARGAQVGLAFPWIVAGCCASALANISTAQIGSLNRVGAGLFFSVAANLIAIIGVVVGWKTDGLRGAAAGLCFSKIVLAVQDAFVRRLVGAPYGKPELKLLLILTIQAVVLALFVFLVNILRLGPFGSAAMALTSGCLAAAILFLHLRRRSRPRA